MATIYQVSELAGVSLATVSRVMNNNARVSDKTKQKVLKAMAELDYRPNAIAQSLASNRSNSVGVLVSELHGPFFGMMMSGIDLELRNAGKHAIFTAGHSNETDEQDAIEFLISRNCDALILHVEALSNEYLIKLAQGNVPLVLINRYIDEIADQCFYLNNEDGGYLATKAVLEQGHRQIAYISGPLWKQDARDRLKGHQKALAEYHLNFADTLCYEGAYIEQSGLDGVTEILKQQQPFTALVCANDEMASGAIEMLREQHFTIPQDVSVVGFDNVNFSRYLFPKLTTINFPIGEMGVMAAHWVLRHIYRQEQYQINHLFMPQLAWRDSVTTPKSNSR